MKERVLILGAAGFIGTALRSALASQYTVLSVDDAELPPLPDGRAPSDEHALQLDLARPDHIDTLFEQLAPHLPHLAGVIDLVAYYDFQDKPDPRYGAVERGLAYLLEQSAQRLPPDVPFIYASSMASLAPTEPGVALTPASPRSGQWQYPAHKLRCEAILEGADIPQPRVELVLAGVYSAWCELVPLYQQLERIRQQSVEALFYPGPSDRGLTYAQVDEVAEAFRLSLESFRGQAGVHRLLIGEERPVEYARIHRIASERWNGRVKPLVRVPKLLARSGAAVLGQISGQRRFIQPWMVTFAGEHFEFDLSETRQALGWAPRGSLAEALGPMCDRAAEHPKEWQRRNEARPW